LIRFFFSVEPFRDLLVCEGACMPRPVFRYCFLLAAALFLAAVGQAQPTGLRRYTDTGDLRIHRTLDLANNSRVWIANHFAPNPAQPSSPSISGILQCTDPNGQRLWSFKIPNTRFVALSAFPSSAILVAGLTASQTAGNVYSSLFLLCFSPTGEFRWRRDITLPAPAPVNAFSDATLLIPLQSGRIFLAAGISTTPYGRYLLARFDEEGNFLMQKQVRFPDGYLFSDAIQEANGDILIGANDVGFSANSARLISVDTAGNYQYARRINRTGFNLYNLLRASRSASIYIGGFDANGGTNGLVTNSLPHTLYRLQGGARDAGTLSSLSFRPLRRQCVGTPLNYAIDSTDAIYVLPGGRSYTGYLLDQGVRDEVGSSKPVLACKFDSVLNTLWTRNFFLPIPSTGANQYSGFQSHGLIRGNRVTAMIAHMAELPPLTPSASPTRIAAWQMIWDTAGNMTNCLQVSDSLVTRRGSVDLLPIDPQVTYPAQGVIVSTGALFPTNSSTVFVQDTCIGRRPPRSRFGVMPSFTGGDFGNVFCLQSNFYFMDSSYWAPQTWQWVFPPQADLSQADSTCFPNVTNVRFTETGVFPVTLITQNETGSDTLTTLVTITGLIPRPVIGNDTTICRGDSVRLVYQPVPNSSHYFFQPGGRFFSTADTVYVRDGGTYICVATSPCGIQTDTIQLTVLEPPGARFGYTAPCGQLQVFFADSSTTGGSTALQYRWEFMNREGALLGLAFQRNPDFTFPAFDTVRVRLIVSSGAPCGFTDTVMRTILLRPKPLASFGWSDTCGSLAASFASTASSATGSIIRYHWSFGDGTASATPNPVHRFPAFGEYPVRLVVETEQGCLSDTLTRTVVLRAKPVAAFRYNSDACEGAPFLLTDSSTVAATGIGQHYWRLLPSGQVYNGSTIQPVLPEGSYTVQYAVRSLQGCASDTVEREIRVDSRPVVSLRDTLGCTGTELRLSAQINQAVGSIASYQWFVNGQVSSLLSPVFTFNNEGQFPVQLEVQSGNGCRGGSMALVRIEKTPQPQFVYGPPCLNTVVPFTNSSPDSSAYTWQWSINGSEVAQSPSAAYRFPRAGVFNIALTGRSPGGCRATASQTVMVQDFDLRLTASGNPVFRGEEIRLLTSSTLPYTILRWEPASLFSAATARSQAFTADTSRQYMVIGEAAGGCRDTTILWIEVRPLSDVYIPSAFTPNGDGRNELLRVLGAGFSEFQFSVFNRWGQVVFRSRNPALGWDGTVAGKRAESGTYAYLLEATRTDGQKILRKGTVVLIR
jgi:gliding motility-associated-like protein